MDKGNKFVMKDLRDAFGKHFFEGLRGRKALPYSTQQGQSETK